MIENRIDVAVAVLDAGPTATKAKPEVRLLRAEVDYRAGRLDAARTAYEDLLGALSGESEPLQRAQVLIALGSIARTSADFVEAERDYVQAIALLAPLHDAIALVRAHLYRGTALVSLTRFDEASQLRRLDRSYIWRGPAAREPQAERGQHGDYTCAPPQSSLSPCRRLARSDLQRGQRSRSGVVV